MLLLFLTVLVNVPFMFPADDWSQFRHRPDVLKGAGTNESRILSSYLGGTGNEFAQAAGMDSNGNLYVAGSTSSLNFPLIHPLQARKKGGLDIFLTKISPSGEVTFSTYFGGAGADQLYDLAVDRNGSVVLVGETASSDFPLINALQSRRKGSNDAFITIVSADGRRILFSTYMGGTSDDSALAVDLDGAGNIYLAGGTGSSDFPVVNPFQPRLNDFEDAFVLKLSPDGKRILYSSYLGGNLGDAAYDLAVSVAGWAVITGVTDSHDFPLKNAFQPKIAGEQDTFVTKVTPSGALVFSTFLGGRSSDWGQGVALDERNDIFLTGFTVSNNFPLKNAFQNRNSGSFKVYVTKMTPSGQSLIYSTYLGGTRGETAWAVCVDHSDRPVVVGRTSSSDFPVVNPWQSHNLGQSYGDDAFITRFSSNGRHLEFSTFVGGKFSERATKVFCGPNSRITVVGSTDSFNFPTVHAFQDSKAGGIRTQDAFVVEAE